MKSKLISLGLTEREAEAYEALSNFEEATATELSKIVKEHRSNIYDSLQKLIQKGLVVYSIKNRIKYFKLANPTKILDYIKEKEKVAEEIIPLLEKRSYEDKPVVEVYEGKEGFKSILSLMLREKKTIYAIAASEEWEKRFPIKTSQFMTQREKLKIKAKLLYLKGSQPIKSCMNQIRYLPIEHSQPSTIAIFGDFVVVFMWTTPLMATLTKSKEYSESFQKYFNLLWKQAKT